MNELGATLAGSRTAVAKATQATVPVSAEAIRRGRELARLELGEIVAKTKRWAATGRLNRGLRLSLPYYDDRVMEMRWIDLEVIPPGRVMFVPAFVVMAAHQGAVRLGRDANMNASTREHALSLLRELQLAFGPVPGEFEIEGLAA